jgi:hypothetical protein
MIAALVRAAIAGAAALARRVAQRIRGRNARCTTNCARPRTRRELEEESGANLDQRGNVNQGWLNGGVKRLDRDFDALQPRDVISRTTPSGSLRVGTLDDGVRVTARHFSKTGPPTLEFRLPNNRLVKIRYRP